VHTTVELQVGCVAVLPCGRQCWCWCCRGSVVRCTDGRWAVLGAAPSACAHLCRPAGWVCCSAAMLPVVLVPSCGALCWTQIGRLYCAVCGAGAATHAGARCSMLAGRVCCWLAGCGSCIRHVGQTQLLLAGSFGCFLRHLFPQLVLPGW
jgi:hypothetical protein